MCTAPIAPLQIRCRCKLLLLFIFLIAYQDISKAQHITGDGASAGMGYGVTALPGSWSLFHNQAGLARLKSLSFATGFQTHYQIEGVSTKSFAAGIPIHNAAFGLSWQSFGYSAYSESKLSLGYGMLLGKKIAAGFALDYFALRFPAQYGKTSTVTAEIGLMAQPLKNFHIGAHIFNPFLAGNQIDEQLNLPVTFRLGVAYEFSPEFMLVSEFEKDNHGDAALKAGFGYEALKNLWFRAGIQQQPESYFLGLGYRLKNLKFDFAFSNHAFLGNSSHVSLLFNL